MLKSKVIPNKMKNNFVGQPPIILDGDKPTTRWLTMNAKAILTKPVLMFRLKPIKIATITGDNFPA
jgi:hypothetical protein